MIMHKKNKTETKNITHNINTHKTNKKETIFNLPNSLTILRLILAPVFMILLLNNKYVAAFVVILIASITDFPAAKSNSSGLLMSGVAI